MFTSVIRSGQGQQGFSLLDAGGQPVQVGAAAPNYIATSQPAVAAAALVGFATAQQIRRRGSGVIVLRATITVTSSGAGTITMSFARDTSGPLQPVVQTILGAAGTISMSHDFIDIINDDLLHSYSVQAAISAGTVAMSSNQGILTVVEL